MPYDAIVRDLGADGSGVQSFDQRSVVPRYGGYGSAGSAVAPGAGICQGLSTEWLKSKKAGTEFHPDGDALLGKYRTVAAGHMEHREYVDGHAAGHGDEITFQSLAGDGIARNSAEDYDSTVLGFAESAYGIATRVLSSRARYFLLFLPGHALAMFRPYAWVGKSSTIYLFDPLEGEFRVEGQEGVRKVLNALRTHTYPRSYLKGFTLHAFTG